MADSKNIPKNKLLNILDWVVAIVSIAYAIVFLVIEWPNPTYITWGVLAFGVISLVAAYFNPVEKITKWVIRKLVVR